LSQSLNYNIGTLNELLLSLHLSLSNTFPTHYRGSSMSPRIIHDKLKEEVGPVYDKIYQHTYEMSIEAKSKFVTDLVMANTRDISEIAWTASPAKDTEHIKFTGKSDPFSDADIMIKTESGNYVGISAKYGATKTSTLRSPGASYISKLLNLGNISKPVEDHNLYMESLGFTGSLFERKEQYKKIRGSSLARQASKSMIDARKKICREIHEALKLKSSSELEKIILDFIAPVTIFPHYRSQTIVSTDNVVHNIYDIRKKTLSIIENYTSFYLHQLHNDTAYVTVYGMNEHSNIEEPIIKYSAKNKNTPMMGWDGHIVSPMLNRKKNHE
jgi:hypothetical protein